MPESPVRRRSRRVPADEARRRIVDATRELLQGRGYDQLRVEDVMAASGLPRTVFYRHFSTLTEVVLSLMDDLVSAIEHSLEPQALGGHEGLQDHELLRRQLDQVVAVYVEHGPLLIAVEAAGREDPDVARAYQAWIDRGVRVSASLLTQGIANGITPHMPVEGVAAALHAMNRAYLTGLIAHNGEINQSAAVEVLWTVWARTTLREPPADAPNAADGK